MEKSVALAIAKSLLFVGVGASASVAFGFELGRRWEQRFEDSYRAIRPEQQKQASEEPHRDQVGRFLLRCERNAGRVICYQLDAIPDAGVVGHVKPGTDKDHCACAKRTPRFGAC